MITKEFLENQFNAIKQTRDECNGALQELGFLIEQFKDLEQSSDDTKEVIIESVSSG